MTCIRWTWPGPRRAQVEPLTVIGRVLRNRYKIVDEIGSGGFGTVYLAEEVGVPGRYWALKSLSVVAPDPFEAQRLSELFDREQKILSWLSHPSIVARREVITEGATVYLVMEYVDGEDLRRIVSRRKRELSPRVVVHVAEQVCDILTYLHGQKPHPIVYRDLKPSNLMVTREGKIKLVDFGIARVARMVQSEEAIALAPRSTSEEPTEVLGPREEVTELQMDPASLRLAQRLLDQGQSASGDTTCMGTPGYAAPEQYANSGMRTDARADLYALGVILFHLVTGEDPAKMPIPLPGMRRYVGCDEILENIVLKATAANREQRYSAAQVMGKALASYRERLGPGHSSLDEEFARLIPRSRLPASAAPVLKRTPAPAPARVQNPPLPVAATPKPPPAARRKLPSLPVLPDLRKPLSLILALLLTWLFYDQGWPLVRDLLPDRREFCDCSLHLGMKTFYLRETGEVALGDALGGPSRSAYLSQERAAYYLPRLAHRQDWMARHPEVRTQGEPIDPAVFAFVSLRVGNEPHVPVTVSLQTLRRSGALEMWHQILKEANLSDPLPP